MPHEPPTGDLLLESCSDILDLIKHLAAASTQFQLAYLANDLDNAKQAIAELDKATTSLCNATDLLVEIKNKAVQWRHWAAQSIRDNK